jgi:hypothetical protein
MLKTCLLSFLLVAAMVIGAAFEVRADSFGVNPNFSSSGESSSSASAAKPKPVPEPSSLILLASGVAGLIVVKVRSRKNRDSSTRD